MVMMYKVRICQILSLVCGLSLGLAPAWADAPLNLLTSDATVAKLKEDGSRYLVMGFDTLAVQALRSAIALEDRANLLPSQRDSEVPFNLGLIYLRQGKIGEARDLFRRSVEADPRSFQARYQLALTELKSGNKEAAREQFIILENAANTNKNPEMQAHLRTFLATLDPPQPKASVAPTPGAALLLEPPLTPSTTPTLSPAQP